METNQREFLKTSIVINIIITAVLVAGGLWWYDQNQPDTIHTEEPRVGGQVAELASTGIEDVVAEVNPAVVSIVVTKDVPIIEQYYEDYDPFGFGGLFGWQMPRYRENGTEEREVGGGSGFIVSADGLVVTNRHVLDDDEAEYTLFTIDGEQYEVEIVARDPILDIAVMQIQNPPEDLAYLEFGDSSQLRLGQTVIAIGNALAEFRNSVSVGVVSGLSRQITAGSRATGMVETLDEVIQTDAAINPGNSGGPLLDAAGRVIGVNVAVAARGENIGFALPGNVVAGVVASVEEFGEIVRPFIGVRYAQITERMQERNNLEYDYGVIIQRGESREDLAVLPGSPADRAGLRENDIILEVDGEKLTPENSLARMIRRYQVGDEITLRVSSGGNEKDVTLTLDRAPTMD
jgi:S1-C subfamily serine protease